MNTTQHELVPTESDDAILIPIHLYVFLVTSKAKYQNDPNKVKKCHMFQVKGVTLAQGTDLEIVVYPGILVPRIYLRLQNIFKEFSDSDHFS